MVRFSVFAIFLVSAIVFNFAECSNGEFGSKIELNFVQNLTDFLRANPDVQLDPLVEEVSNDTPSLRLQRVYRLGNRISDDRLLATDQSSQSWTTPQNVRLNLNYPKSGYAEVITYLEINVQQSTNLGSAYVTSGGIGQRRISVVVEASQTLYWQYQAAIYGY